MTASAPVLRLALALGLVLAIAAAGSTPAWALPPLDGPPSVALPALPALPQPFESQTLAVRPQRGVVFAWQEGRLTRLAGAFVATGATTVRTNASGRFTLPAHLRTDRLAVVKSGYKVVRRQAWQDYVVIFLQPLTPRAVYIPYDRLRAQAVLDWALGLARDGTINAIVIDIKDEGGAVLPQVATPLVREIGAVVDPGTDVSAFLRDLGDLGVYRIARVVTFLDSRFAFARRADALHHADGSVFVDSIGLAWSSPYSAVARRYNIEIGAAAAAYFEEVQYDYVRLPTDSGLAERAGSTSASRSAAMARFAQEASEALHAAGLALAFDTFGLTTVVPHDDGIGQVLEDLGPYLDYFSPMVYPSTWTPGWFDLAYPPADPYTVVWTSVRRAIERLAPFPNVVVRPWLQDFHDYQAQKLFYGANEVREQIEANLAAGGQGFMLWDPGLSYQEGVLADLRPPTLARTAAPPLLASPVPAETPPHGR